MALEELKMEPGDRCTFMHLLETGGRRVVKHSEDESAHLFIGARSEGDRAERGLQRRAWVVPEGGKVEMSNSNNDGSWC